MKRVTSKVMNQVKSMDWFGQNILITYNKENKFNTHLGGWMTLTVIIAFILYSLYLIRTMIKRQTVVYSTNTVIRDLTNDSEDHRPAEHGFAIAIGFRWETTSLLDDAYLQLYELQVQQHIAINTGGGFFDEQFIDLEVEKCGDLFPYYNQTLVRDFYINNYVWIKPKDYAITGNWYSSVVKSLNIYLSSWNALKRTDCKSYTVSDANLASQDFDIVIIDSYFDLKSFEKPIKTYLTQQYHYRLQGGFYQNIELFVKENTIDALDDYKIIEGAKNGRFYSVADSSSSSTKLNTNTYASVTIFLHPETQVYNRAVFTFMDVLAQIGGIFGLIQPVCALFVGFYAEKMLYYSIFKKWYTVDTDEPEKKSAIAPFPKISKITRCDMNKVKIDTKRVKRKKEEGVNGLELEGGEEETTMNEKLWAKIGKSENPTFFLFS